MAYSVFERSGARFASGKRVNQKSRSVRVGCGAGLVPARRTFDAGFDKAVQHLDDHARLFPDHRSRGDRRDRRRWRYLLKRKSRHGASPRRRVETLPGILRYHARTTCRTNRSTLSNADAKIGAQYVQNCGNTFSIVDLSIANYHQLFVPSQPYFEYYYQ